MGFSSQDGYVGFRTYAGGAAAWPSDMGTAGVVYRLRSGSLAANRDLMIPDPEIGGNRDIPSAQLGPVSWSGDLDMYVRAQNIMTLLAAVMGTPAAAVVSTGVAVWTIPTSDAALPFLAVEERIGTSFETFRFLNCVGNSLHLEADASSYLTGTVGIIAQSQTAGATGSTSILNKTDNSPLIPGTNITIQYNGVSLQAKSFSLDITNNIEDNDFRLGSFYVGEFTPKRREGSANVTIRPVDSALWRQAVYGASTATAAGGLVTTQQLIIQCETWESIPGGTPPTLYRIRWVIPSVILNPFDVGPSGDDVIEESIDMTFVRPNVGTPLATCTVKTELAVIA